MLLTLQKITRWYVWNNESESWEFSHIDDDWVFDKKPTPKFQGQLEDGWKSKYWQRVHDYRYPITKKLLTIKPQLCMN